MYDGYDSEQDFVLPPLPSKPQKTLLSFLKSSTNSNKGKKQGTNKHDKTSDNDTMLNSDESENSPLKWRKKRRGGRCVKQILSEDDLSEQEEDHSKKLTDLNQLNSGRSKNSQGGCENIAAIGVEQSCTLKGCENSCQDGEQHQLKPADVLLKTEFIKCDIPTPFPVVNHVIQTNEESAKLYIKEISKWKTLDDKNDDDYVDISENSWKSLLNLNLKNENCYVSVDQPVTKTLEEWLQKLETEHEDFPTRKVFQQYLACQRKVVMSDLQRIQSSKLAVEALWQKDSEVQNIEQQTIQPKEAIQEKSKEGKDIRKMFLNSKTKKKKQKAVANDFSKDVEKDLTSPDGTGRLRSSTRRKKPVEDSTVEESLDVKTTISTSGLFKDTSNKRGRRKRKSVVNKESEESENVESSQDTNEISTKASASLQRVKKDIRTLFQNQKTVCDSGRTDAVEDPTTEAVGETANSKDNEKNFQVKSSEQDTTEQDDIVEKKKKKKKRTFDFLKIKLLPSKDETESLDKDVVIPKNNIKSMFAKMQKSKSEENIANTTEESKGATQEEDGSVSDNCINDSVVAIVEMNTEVDVKEHSEQAEISENTPNDHADTILKPKRKSATDIRSFFGSRNVKQEDTSKSSESVSVETNLPKAIDPSNEQGAIKTDQLCSENASLPLATTTHSNMKSDKTSCVSMVSYSKTSTKRETSPVRKTANNDIKSELSDTKCDVKREIQTTPCKVEVENIVSPCRVMAEDISPLIQANPSKIFACDLKTEDAEENKQTRAKRKRNFSQSGSNKKLKQNEAQVVNRRSLRCTENTQPEERDTVKVEDQSGSNEDQPGINDTVEIPEKVVKCEKVEQENEDNNRRSLRRSSRSRKKINYNESSMIENIVNSTQPVTELKKEEHKKKGKSKKSDSTLIVLDGQGENKSPDNILLDQSVLCIEDKNNNNNSDIRSTTLMAPLSPKKVRPTVELVLDETTINSFLSWTEKYQPMKARFVIGDKAVVKELFNWLCSWKERHESIVKRIAERAAKKPSKTNTDDESEIEDSEEEELLTNTLLLSGPPGCGTTAAVYACAKQIDFKVLELNPNMYRTGKRVYDLVSEAVVSHQVRKGIKGRSSERNMSTFFKSSKQDATTTNDTPQEKEASKDLIRDAMSLVLFEQSDIYYEDYDRGFWQGVADLRLLAKRPIILTANDDKVLSLVDTEEKIPVEHISMTYPTTEQLLPMMQVACLVEQIFVPSSLLRSIIEYCRNDVRKVMMQLQFWFDQGKQPLFSRSKTHKNQTCDITSSEKPAMSESRNEVNGERENTCESHPLQTSGTISEISDVEEKEKMTLEIKTDVNQNLGDGKYRCLDDKINLIDEKIEVCKSELEIDNSQQVTDQTMATECVVDVEMKESQSIVGARTMNDPIFIEETMLKRFPVHQEETELFNVKKVIDEIPHRTTKTSRYFTFTKAAALKNLSDEHQALTTISDHADQLSEIDSNLMPGCTYLNKDLFQRSAYVDSLNENVSSDTTNHYPSDELCSSVRNMFHACYEYMMEQKLSFGSPSHERINKFRSTYNAVTQRMLSTYFERSARSREVLPSFENICRAEELRKNTQQRRKQRRFLHYLDLSGMCFDEETMAQFGSGFFDTV